MRRAAPGPQLGVGRIRVDAARAIAKLREYQLADRTAWILEAIRAAVASGATAIELTGDSNDVTLTWAGPTWAADELPRLLDELVSPDGDRHHVRLLAAAVNSALGLEPAYVDVIAIGDRGASRVRFTPDVLAEVADADDSPLRKLAAQPITAPAGVAPGMRVHLRRRVSLEVLSYLFTQPPEVALARAACRDITVPLRIGTTTYHRDSTADVLRMPSTDGFVAIGLDGSGPRMDILERGVLLAVEPLAVPFLAGARVPIRIVVDAPRMPTNASRSKVRTDAPPIAEPYARAGELITAALAQLATAPNAREAAFAVLAGALPGPVWTWNEIPAPLWPLAEVPLVRDAIGRDVPLKRRWSHLVHTGKAPLPAELEPWLADVLWIPPGDAAARLVRGYALDARGLRRRLRHARRQLRARDAFFAHEQRRATVVARAQPRVRANLAALVPDSCVPGSAFEGLSGEVCVHADGDSTLVVLHHGRELDRRTFASEIPFEAVIDAPHVTPGDRYRNAVSDGALARVIVAMRYGVLHALEGLAIALAGGGLPRGIDVADLDRPLDARLVRTAIALAREMQTPIYGPLAAAPAWPTATDDWVSLLDLTRLRAVGTVTGRLAHLPRLSLILRDRDRRLLALALPDLAQVRYEHGRLDSRELARRLAGQFGAALAIDGFDHRGAIAPAKRPELALHHATQLIETRLYRPALTPVAIALDDDAIVPSTEWNFVVDDDGERALPTWELALARAAAAAFAGDRPPELYGDVRFDGPLGDALCDALAAGADIDTTKLRTVPLFHRLGQPFPVSVESMTEDPIPYIREACPPISDFAPVVCDDRTAKALARLARKPVREASAEIARARRIALWTERLTRHRLLPEREMTVAGESVELRGTIAQGTVGIGRNGLVIEVHVEKRPYYVIRRADDLPLYAAVDIELASAGDEFDKPSAETIEQIVSEVCRGAPSLLLHLARVTPTQLGDATSARALFASWIANAPIATVTREKLCAAPAFLTVQGQRTSIAAASEPRNVLSVARWQGDWLPREDGESASPFDDPVIQLPASSSELDTIFARLFRGALVDVTDEVVRLQANRRMARGLLPKPHVRQAQPAMTRSLASLGPVAAKLGHGEVGLLDNDFAHAAIHVGGEWKIGLHLDVLPPIELAIEAPDMLARAVDPHPISPLAQEVALALVRAIAADTKDLPQTVRAGLRRAVLAKRIAPATLAGIDLFPTLAGKWKDARALDDQIAKYGNAWAVTETPAHKTPLDLERVVFDLTAAEYTLARGSGYALIDAADELAKDALARANQAREPAQHLRVEHAATLAEVVLRGDGITAPRGTIAILAPSEHNRRGLRPHRAMHPFDSLPDPCRWPTRAVVDDARLSPSRTWSAPLVDDVWRELVRVVCRASEDAFDGLLQAPADALATEPIRPAYKTDRVELRGALWLVGSPLDNPGIRVVEPSGDRTVYQPGVGGEIYAAGTLVDADTLLANVHGALLRRLAERKNFDDDRVTAHLANAVATGMLMPMEAKGARFRCFKPPIDAHALVAWLDGKGDAQLDRSSMTGQVIAARLRPRIELPPIPDPAPRHPLEPTLNRIRARLAAIGVPWTAWMIVEDRESPMFELTSGRLRVAARNPKLIDPSDDALEAITAHAVTVLNIALTEITDASEMHALAALLSGPAPASRSP